MLENARDFVCRPGQGHPALAAPVPPQPRVHARRRRRRARPGSPAKNTAIFSVVNAVLLKTLPFPEADRLIVFQQLQGDGNGFSAGSPAKFQFWRSQSTVVRHRRLSQQRHELCRRRRPEQFRASQVSSDYFRLFGVPIIRGRAISATEDLPNAPKVALVSERLWHRRFQSNPAMLGRLISLSGEPHTVIGIVGDGFDVSEFGRTRRCSVPFQLDPNTGDQGHYSQVAGKLKAGVSSWPRPTPA